MAERNRNNSPGLAKKLLRRMSVYCENHSIIEDFEETFSEISQSEGRFRAKCWYWGSALKSVGGYLKLIMFWRFTMLKNHLIIAYRNFVRNKLYSFINVFGLAIGLSICMIISLWVLRELSYDRFHGNARRIYRVERELFRDNLYSKWPITGGAYKQALIDDYPEIENAVRFWKREFAVKDHNNLVHRQELFAVDNSVFDIFDFHLEEGDEKTALKEPLTVVLTRKNAVKYFGAGEAIGKSLSLEWQGTLSDFKVTGILAEVPENSHIHFDMLMSIASYPEGQFANWRGNYLYTYVLVRENTLKNDLEEKLKAFVSQRLEPHYGDLLKPNQNRSIHEVLKMHLFPISDIHLHPGVNWEIEPGVNILSVYIFSCVAVLILVIACMNFVNLSTARAGKRAKEVSLRKTVGAEKHELRVQFIQESVLLAFVSLVLALIMSSLFVKAYNGIFAENLSLSLLKQPENLIILIGATFAVGVLAGLYPAYYLTRFTPVEVMRGGPLSGTGKPVFRRNLVIVQYCISIILIIAVITVYRQMRYMQTRSLGFEKENVVILPVRSQQIAKNYESFRNGLERSPQIISASASSEVPADSNYSNDGVKRPGSDEPINMIIFFSDYDYVETYRMELLAGRTFSRDFSRDKEGAIILNEAAAHKIGWMPEEAIGKKLKGAFSKDEVPVMGVVKNFHFRSLRMEVEPMVLFLNPDYIRKISVRIAPGDIEKILNFIKKTWETAFPGEQFEYSFLDNRINQLYESEMKMKDLFVIFSALSILVACLGLLGLVSFTAELKTKEIGIRKVLGASTGRVIVMLSKEFVKWIMFANIVAWPLAWFMMNRWLQNFAYRIHIGTGILVLSAAFVLVISLSTVSYQFIKAASANPADSLRYE
jgi:putative ABC transport system permease protein